MKINRHLKIGGSTAPTRAPKPRARHSDTVTGVVLDSDQFAACAWRRGEAVCAAVAGSGKSTTLVERAADLVGDGVLPGAILLLTFNRDAANALRTKLTARLGEEVGASICAQTYHAFCFTAIRKWAEGGDRRQIIGIDDGPSKASILYPILRTLGISGDADEWSAADERVREAGIDVLAPGAERELAETRWGAQASALIRICRAYAEAKKTRKLIDFTDMLCEVATECRQDTYRARRLASFAHVMVDEAQDTSPIQQQIALYLGRDATSFLWVGDIRQSIYSFRGANPGLLLERVKAGATLLPIRTCYRSTSAVVEASNAVARGTEWHLGGDARARAGAPAGNRPRLTVGTAADVADEIDALVQSGEALAEKDGALRLAVLVRTNATATDVECALFARNIPARVLGNAGGMWASRTGRQVRAYLQGATGGVPEDLSRIANAPVRYLRGDVLQQAIQAAGKDGSIIGALYDRQDRAAGRLASDLERLAGLPWGERCSEIARWLQQDARERAVTAGGDPDEDRIATIQAIAKAADESGSLEAIEEQAAKARKAEKIPAVAIGTVHKAKGAEWNRVWVYGADKGQFPHLKATTSAELDEEKRLLYVALSRAKDVLTIVTSSLSAVSPFVPARDTGAIEWPPEFTLPPTKPTDPPRSVLQVLEGRGLHGTMIHDSITVDAPAARVDEITAAVKAFAETRNARSFDTETDPLLASPTPTLEAIGPDPKPAPGTKYVPVRLVAIRALLEPRGFHGYGAAGQYVFERAFVEK